MPQSQPRRRSVWAASLMLGLLAACSGASSEDPGDSASAGAEGMAAAVEEFARPLEDVRGVSVTVGAEPVFHRYFDDSESEYANVASVTKSVMSILVGIAIAEGHLPGVDATLTQLLPDRRDQMAPGVHDVTLEQVLTMTGGVRQDDPRSEVHFVASEDWVGAILAEPLEFPPGEEFAYSSAGSHLLSAILVEATGRSVLEYARERLFDPLGIDTTPAAQPLLALKNLDAYERADFAWPRDPQGYHTGDTALKLTLEDMTKIGQLMLDDGEWDGQQIVPRSWVEESTRAHVDDLATSPSNSVITPAYGYQWWVATADGHPSFVAAGYGGQLIEVVPELELVVAVSTHISFDRPPRLQPHTLVKLVDYVIAREVQE
jgi:CubicO group peptidase (beta-lactamase class C family)